MIIYPCLELTDGRVALAAVIVAQEVDRCLALLQHRLVLKQHLLILIRLFKKKKIGSGYGSNYDFFQITFFLYKECILRKLTKLLIIQLFLQIRIYKEKRTEFLNSRRKKIFQTDMLFQFGIQNTGSDA